MKIIVSWNNDEQETAGYGCAVCYVEDAELTVVTSTDAKCDCSASGCKIHWCNSVSGLHMARRLHRAGLVTDIDLQESPTREHVTQLIEGEKRQLRHDMMMATSQLDMFTNEPALPGPGPKAGPDSLGLLNPERRAFVKNWLALPHPGKPSNAAHPAGAKLI